jgi:6-phosphogluconolactonase
MSMHPKALTFAVLTAIFTAACSDSSGSGPASGTGGAGPGAGASSTVAGSTVTGSSGGSVDTASTTGATGAGVGSGVGGAGSGGGSAVGAGGAGNAPDAAGPSDASPGGSAPEGGAADSGGTTTPPRDASGPSKLFAYVSGYAAPITVFNLNATTGALTPGSTASTGATGEPTSLAFAPNKRVVYAGDEQKDQPASRVIAYAIDQTTGALAEINREDTGGTTLAHVGVHPSGKWVLSANYGTGNVTVFPVRADGGLGPAMPRVSAGGQSHFILFDSTGTFLFVPCVAARYIAQFRFADGVLTPNVPPTVAVNGSPRHMALTPDERFAYAISQSDSVIFSYTVDKTTGRLTPLENVNATASPTLGAHVAVHPSGKFLYASSRSDNSIVIFTIDPTTGRLTRVGYQRDMISYPWWFGLDPAGQLLLVASDRTASVLAHRVDPTTGALQTLGMPVSVAMRPTYVGVLSLP